MNFLTAGHKNREEEYEIMDFMDQFKSIAEVITTTVDATVADTGLKP
jgi:hypothetical protein